MTEVDSARRFSKAVTDVLRGTPDPNELLVASDAVLNTFRTGDDRISFLRHLAFKCCDWSVFQTDEYLAQLKLAARAFNLACDIKHTADRIRLTQT
jgi:hypothetical protein